MPLLYQNIDHRMQLFESLLWEQREFNKYRLYTSYPSRVYRFNSLPEACNKFIELLLNNKELSSEEKAVDLMRLTALKFKDN